MRKTTIVLVCASYAASFTCFYALYQFLKHCDAVPLSCCVIITVMLIGLALSFMIAGSALLDDE